MKRLYSEALVEYRPVSRLNSVTYDGYDYMKFMDYAPNSYLINLVGRLGVKGEGKYILLNQRKLDDRYLYDCSGMSLQEYLSGEDLGMEFRYCSFDEMSVEEQYEICSGAAIFIGAHGAGNTNMIFTPSNCRLLEINLRLHWYCDPVCKDHLENRISINSRCNGRLTYCSEYHKADYHNLCKLLGRGYNEITPVRYGGGFNSDNPISRQSIYIDGKRLVELLRTLV